MSDKRIATHVVEGGVRMMMTHGTLLLHLLRRPMVVWQLLHDTGTVQEEHVDVLMCLLVTGRVNQCE
jgi:hypothetical protein